MTKDEKFMKQALKQAQRAFEKSEVPIGAILVKDNKIIARAHNTRNASKDATAHAEILAIRKACKKINDWRLENSVLYVTLEPCPMCLGACLNARIEKVVFGAYETGSTAPDVFKGVNHTCQMQGGVLQNECSTMLKNYFKQKRCQNVTE